MDSQTEMSWIEGYQNPNHPEDHGIPVVRISADSSPSQYAYPDGQINVVVHPGKTVVEACGKAPGDEEPKKTINGSLFQVFDNSSTTMHASSTQKIYRTYRNGTCFMIGSFGLMRVRAGEDDVPEKRLKGYMPPSDEELLSIVRSFTFLDKKQ